MNEHNMRIPMVVDKDFQIGNFKIYYFNIKSLFKNNKKIWTKEWLEFYFWLLKPKFRSKFMSNGKKTYTIQFWYFALEIILDTSS